MLSFSAPIMALDLSTLLVTLMSYVEGPLHAFWMLALKSNLTSPQHIFNAEIDGHGILPLGQFMPNTHPMVESSGTWGWHKLLKTVLYTCSFGVPGIRPDTRRVLKVRPRSDFHRADMLSCHISTLMQDCWSQCRTEHSYVCIWYQTD